MTSSALLTITLPDGRTWETPLKAEVVALLLAEAEYPASFRGLDAPGTNLAPVSPAEVAAGRLEGMLRRSLLV